MSTQSMRQPKNLAALTHYPARAAWVVAQFGVAALFTAGMTTGWPGFGVAAAAHLVMFVLLFPGSAVVLLVVAVLPGFDRLAEVHRVKTLVWEWISAACLAAWFWWYL